MSREIKFRIWNKRKELMSSFGYGSGLSVGESLLVLPKDDNFILLQYINQKDRNGIEIYEGDIVRHASNHDLKGIVTYVRKEFIFKRVHRPRDGGVFIPFRPKNLIEVIGNVHEHPELLK